MTESFLFFKARQREKVTDEHNTRLSATVDKLLAESNERLQTQLRERMQTLEDKNHLVQESEKLKRQLEESQNERTKLVEEIDKLKIELENLRKELLRVQQQQQQQQQQKATESIPIPIQNSIPQEFVPNTVDSLSRRSPQSRLTKPTTTVPDHRLFKTSETEWDTIDQAQVINDVRLAFESSDVELTTDDEDSLYQHHHPVTINNGTMSAQPMHNDAQALALVLQEQLDAINNEIRLIQAEKVDAELRAEELESRVGSSVYHLTDGLDDDDDEDELNHHQMHRSTNGSIGPYQSHLSPAYMRNSPPITSTNFSAARLPPMDKRSKFNTVFIQNNN